MIKFCDNVYTNVGPKTCSVKSLSKAILCAPGRHVVISKPNCGIFIVLFLGKLRGGDPPRVYWPGDLNSYINCFILVSKTSASTSSADQLKNLAINFSKDQILVYNISQQDRLNNGFQLNILMLVNVKIRCFYA